MFRSAALIGVLCAGAYAEEWVNLFNGKDLEGWEKKGGAATYHVEGDAIVGRAVPNSENTFLTTKQHYQDFILEFEFMSHADLNSGVQIRSQSLKEYKDGRVHGYQVELEEDSRDRDWSGGIYDEARRGWLYPAEDSPEAKPFSEQGKKVWKTGEWNQVRVEARGDHIQTWVNGEKRADLHDDMTPKGFIALQVHGIGNRLGETLEVKWRNIRVQELEGEKE